jgi:hypothetical protein
VAPPGETCLHATGPGIRSINALRRWAKTEHWQAIFEALQEPDLDWAMIDSTLIRAHQQAGGQKKVHRKLKPSAEVEAD